MTRVLASFLLAGAASVLSAQEPSRTSVDSVDRLNAAGRWQNALVLSRDALVLVRARSIGTFREEGCALQAAALWSLRQMGRYDTAADRLTAFDGECTGSDVARQRGTQLDQIRRDVVLPPLPAGGLDTSAIPAFWRVVDTLRADHEPSDALWHSFFSTPGYRLSFTNVQPIREDLEISYRPSRRAELDVLSVKTDDQGARLRHFARALNQRAHVNRMVDSIAHMLPIPAAVQLAQQFLPPGATVGHTPPLVTLAIFRDDAYSAGARGIVVDVLHIEDSDLTKLLAHEFHHSFIGYVSTASRAPQGTPEASLVNALYSLRNEGTADQIDKPYPLVRPGEVMAPYVKRYNDEYEKTPATLRIVDSLVAHAAGDTTLLRAAGERTSTLFWSGGHPNGAYVTRTVLETFGKDSLFVVERNPFALLRVYASAVVAKGGAMPFSAAFVAYLDTLGRRYRN